MMRDKYLTQYVMQSYDLPRYEYESLTYNCSK